MTRRFSRTVSVLALAVLASCAHAPTPPPPKDAAIAAKPAPSAVVRASPEVAVSDAATLAALDRVLAGPTRSDASRQRDAARHPRETLQFFGIRADMTVMEVWPSGGWYAEILAPLLHDRGRYLAAERDPLSSPYANETVKALKLKFAAVPGAYDRAEITSLCPPTALSPAAPNSVDMVLTFRNLHNWLPKPETAQSMLRAIYTVLKPGGTLGIVDHRADPSLPVDPSAKLGYVNTQAAIDLLQQAGFEYVGSSEINANPRDTRDYDQGVWTLPPTYRLGAKDRERYAAIGESDRFTLRFRKPLNAR